MYKILFLIIPLFGSSVSEKNILKNVPPPEIVPDFKTCYCEVEQGVVEMRPSKECIDFWDIMGGIYRKRIGDVLVASDIQQREPQQFDPCYAHKYVYHNRDQFGGRYTSPRFEGTEIVPYNKTVVLTNIPNHNNVNVLYVYGGLVPSSGDIDYMKTSIQELETNILASNENLADSLGGVVEDFEISIRKEVIEGLDSIPLRVIESEAIQQLKNDFEEQIKKLQEQIDELNANQE